MRTSICYKHIKTSSAFWEFQVLFTASLAHQCPPPVLSMDFCLKRLVYFAGTLEAQENRPNNYAIELRHNNLIAHYALKVGLDEVLNHFGICSSGTSTTNNRKSKFLQSPFCIKMDKSLVKGPHFGHLSSIKMVPKPLSGAVSWFTDVT